MDQKHQTLLQALVRLVIETVVLILAFIGAMVIIGSMLTKQTIDRIHEDAARDADQSRVAEVYDRALLNLRKTQEEP